MTMQIKYNLKRLDNKQAPVCYKYKFFTKGEKL